MKINLRKELRDWGVIILVFGLLYVTGTYTDVAAFTQRIVLATGVISPDTNVPEREKKIAEYEFQILTMDGESFDFRDLKGKVVFLNFWASWCAPCIAEMPGIQDIYEDYKDLNDIAFVMITLDREPEKAAKFIAKKDYSFPVYKPDMTEGIPAMYNAPSIPTTFVLNKNGRVDTKKVGMANYDSKKFRKYLDKLLEESQADI
jgi:thiol-disulfide isomerase/thioredoxin